MCIFCKILNGEIPSYKIYEDENVYAFLDIADDAIGHTLVIPKNHYENILDIPEFELESIIKAVKKISLHYTENCGFTGVNIMNASGQSAQQTVFHLHFHIIPRKEDDGMNTWPKLEKANCDFEKICKDLRID